MFQIPGTWKALFALSPRLCFHNQASKRSKLCRPKARNTTRLLNVLPAAGWVFTRLPFLLMK